jgi:23S rRNA pseudouridine1911/1915/1917 synthase
MSVIVPVDSSQSFSVIDHTHTGQRIDRWLAEQCQDLSRSHLQKLIEGHQVWVNREICTSKKYEVQLGDEITVAVPPPTPLNLQPETMPLEILYEDAHLLILNKPAGLVVHPAPGHASGTLVHGLLAHCPDSLSGIGGIQRPGIVHRLDKDTSGALAIAKTDQAHQHLQAQIQAKTAQREYLGIVYGSPKTATGIIDQPIGRHPGDRKQMAIIPAEKGGRNAITHWSIQERLGLFTLMHFALETGRTHQIRVHSALLGHPILGDPLYSKGRSHGMNLEGQVLHAWRLQVQHPITQEPIQVEAPLPATFEKVLRVLRQRLRATT